MSLVQFLPWVSTLITLVFAGAVLTRYVRRRRPHLLLWGLGLIMYGLGTLAEAALGMAWSAFFLRLWYLMGAMLTAAWLGQGTVYLLVRPRGRANVLMGTLGVLSLAALILVASAPLDTAAAAGFDPAEPVSSQYREIMTRKGFTVVLTIILNTYGTATLMGGAVYSAWLFWRKRVLPRRVVANILIAVGALIPATAGTLIRLGLGDWLYLSELLGASLMFLGFLLATAGLMTGANGGKNEA